MLYKSEVFRAYYLYFKGIPTIEVVMSRTMKHDDVGNMVDIDKVLQVAVTATFDVDFKEAHPIPSQCVDLGIRYMKRWLESELLDVDITGQMALRAACWIALNLVSSVGLPIPNRICMFMEQFTDVVWGRGFRCTDFRPVTSAGMCGKVTSDISLAINVITNKLVCIKTFTPEAYESQRLAQMLFVRETVSMEIAEPSGCSSRLITAWWTDGKGAVVSEYCGTSLLSLCSIFTSYRASVIRQTFYRLVLATKALHDQGFAHRDIKLANICIDGNNDVRLIDFDSACAKSDTQMHTNPVCTVTTRAPELLISVIHDTRGYYSGPKLDAWSIGCVVMSMCGCDRRYGYFPGSTEMEVIDSISDMIGIDNELILPAFVTNVLGKAGTAVLQSMMRIDPIARASPFDVYDNVFFDEFK